MNHKTLRAQRGNGSAGSLLPALPAVIFLIAFFLVPLGFMVVVSLTEPTPGFGNYLAIFQSKASQRALLNSFVICAQATVITAAIGCLMVAALIRWKGITRLIVLLSLLLPFVTSGELVRILAWLIFLSPDGFFSRTLTSWGIIAPGTLLVPGRPAILIGLVHILLPFFVLTCYTALRLLDSRLPKASRSLGAPPLQAFLTTTVPLAVASIVGATLLVFVIALGYYATPAGLGGQSDVVLPTLITNQVQRLGNWGTGAALGTMLLVATGVILAIMLRFGGLSVLFSSTGGRSAKAPGWLGRGYNVAVTSLLVRKIASVFARIPSGSVILGAVHRVIVALVCVYLAIPLLVALPASFGESTILSFPPRGFTGRWYGQFASEPAWTGALQTSLLVGLGTCVFSVLLAAGGGLVLARGPERWKMPIFLLLIMPLIMPWTVTALGLYFESVSLGIAYQPLGLIIGHTVGGIPFALIVLISALTAYDWRLDTAAVSLGASRLRRFYDIAFPFLKPAVYGALLFAFIWSFTEVVFAYLMSDSSISTLPVAMWQELTYNITPIVAAAGGVLTGAMFLVGLLYGAAEGAGKYRAWRRARRPLPPTTAAPVSSSPVNRNN